MTKLEAIQQLVEDGMSKKIVAAIEEALSENTAKEILDAMIGAMDRVGENFSKGEIFVPEMLVAAKAMAAGVERLKPLLKESGATSLGLCIIGTVAGDLHDIGKNLVSMMIESAGFDIIDLGIDVPIDKFVAAIQQHPEVKIVALSALLTTTMPALKDTVAALNAIENRTFKIMVGGAPITQEFADEIGADGYSVDAGAAAVLAKSLVK